METEVAAGSSSPEEVKPTGARYLLYGCGSLILLLLSLLLSAVLVSIGGFRAVLIATIAAVLPVPLGASTILWLDKHEREPRGLLVAAFVWGAVVATMLSLIGNLGFGAVVRTIWGSRAAELMTPSLVAPVVEETSKGIALLLMFLLMRHEFDNTLDGIVYGALVGLGFAMTENILYFAKAYQSGGLVGLGVLFYGRAILFGFGHALWTGIFGAGLGMARESDSPAKRILAPAICFLAGVIGHSVWNFGAVLFLGVLGQKVDALVVLFVLLPLQTLVLLVPGLIVLVIIAAMAWARESKIIAAQLYDEIAAGTISAEEFAIVANGRERLGRLLKTLGSNGVRGWLALRNLYDMETELAFRKWHTQRGERLPASQRHKSEEALRRQIKAQRAVLHDLGVTTK